MAALWSIVAMFQYSDQHTVAFGRQWESLKAWYDRTDLGRQLQRAELELVDSALATLFGYHALAVGMPWPEDPLRSSRIAGRHRLDWGNASIHSRADVVGVPEELPVATDSVDVVLLPHVLDCLAHPDAVLDEVDRVLIPEGHVIVIGFNPFSLWGARRLAGGRKGPWSQRFRAPMAVNHQLAVRGYDRVAIRYCYHLPPLGSAAATGRLGWLQTLAGRYAPSVGASYMLLARKRVTTLTPVRPRWRSRRLVVPQGSVTSRTSGGAAP